MPDNVTIMSQVQDALRDFFIEPVRVQMNEEIGPFFAMIEKNEKDVVGKKIKMPLKYGRSGGVGARTEIGALPTPSPREWATAEWDVKNIFARMQISLKLMKASKNKKGAFVQLLADQMDDLLVDAKDNVRRQLFGDGVGSLATCTAATSTNTITVDSLQYLQEGMVIDLLNTDGTVVASARRITSINEANTTITVDGDAIATILDTDFLTVAGSHDLEMTGLAAVFDTDNTIYGIDRTVNNWFVPTITNIAGDIDELDMQKAIDDARDKMGSKIDFIMANSAVIRGFQYNQLSYKKNIDYMDLKGGYKTISFGGIPLSNERYMPDGTMDFLNSKNFKLYRLGDWDWMDEDGAILNRISGQAAYECTLAFFGDLGCDKAKGQSRLTGITGH